MTARAERGWMAATMHSTMTDPALTNQNQLRELQDLCEFYENGLGLGTDFLVRAERSIADQPDVLPANDSSIKGSAPVLPCNAFV